MSDGSGYRKKVRILQLNLAKEISHGICVSNLACRVAREMRFPEATCHELAVAGFLHDVGKLELEKYLYGRENDTLIIEELKYVRMHARLSAKIMEERGYPSYMVEWVYCHHENCDGSGYPRNLTKEEIPLEAKIIRVCDVFAALTTDRPYRKAFDVDTAVDLMIEKIKNYDIEVFLAFLKVIHEDDMKDILDNGRTQQQLECFLNQEQI